jgi:hypothetical protein
MIPGSFRSEALAEAERQANRSDDALLALLEYEWERAGLAVADRGPLGDYLRSVADGIARQVVREHGTVEVITAMAADDTLRWAAEHGFASDQYAMVVGLLVAWVTRAALRRSDSRDEETP